jgi:hypothetical protein
LHSAFSIRFIEEGDSSPYTLSHLSADGRYLLTWGPQRGLQMLNLERRVVVVSIPASQTGSLEGVYCGLEEAPPGAGAGAAAVSNVQPVFFSLRIPSTCRFSALSNCDAQHRRPSFPVALVTDAAKFTAAGSLRDKRCSRHVLTRNRFMTLWAARA